MNHDSAVFFNQLQWRESRDGNELKPTLYFFINLFLTHSFHKVLVFADFEALKQEGGLSMSIQTLIAFSMMLFAAQLCADNHSSAELTWSTGIPVEIYGCSFQPRINGRDQSQKFAK